jgi:hypothetical protein
MSQTNLIVNYLPATLEENEMHQLFAVYGEIDSHKLIRDKHTGMLRALFYTPLHTPQSSASYQSLLVTI